MHLLCPAGLALALVAPASAATSTPAPSTPEAQATSTDIKAIRQEMDAMRTAYEARLQALEARLKAAEAAAAAPPPAATAVVPAPVAPVAAAPAPAPAPTAVANAGGNTFNPAISLILSGQYVRLSQDPADFAITGFQLPADAELGPGERGFGLGETELRLSASIDPWLRGDVTLAIAEDGVEVEEAFVETTALDYGFTLRGGRFFSGIGYLNPQHAHSWDFVDNPLAYQALLGTQHGNDGLRLTWLAPTDQYIELTAEIGRGDSFPGGGNGGHGVGTWSLGAHTGGDMGDSHSWRAGVSMLRAKAWDQELAAIDVNGTAVTNTFTGKGRVWVADAVWKWAPNGNATRTNFKLQGEYLRSTRSGDLVYDLDGANSVGAYRATQSGWYLQGIYQFMPRWRVGLRTEQLDAGSPDYGVNAAILAGTGYQPRKNTLMLDFSPSEFSRFRLQFGQDRSREGVTDNQIFLQYQMSLGAHGAHGF
ncbi:MAG TPA: hypothetical protein VFY73_17970 [Ideonella sp.]|uniref:hypothetical protein n=1 Tax=Ideonella sp. TaxID=1929293 RepID=UPI002E376056|nr:hypothetical protein [Ideonella sp.]HEX5685916.1 hypothetical protein [Ideonella sp.]